MPNFNENAADADFSLTQSSRWTRALLLQTLSSAAMSISILWVQLSQLFNIGAIK